MHGEFYDWAAKDFKTLSDRAGFSFQTADKNHNVGFPLLNTLFKNQMLIIDDIPQTQELINEILTLKWGGWKKDANDDATDSLRYAVSKIPWIIDGEKVIKEKRILTPTEQARPGYFERPDEDNWSIDDEIALWNEEYSL